ncbi:hypothetical protein [Paenibacillus massiliensis]|uniref:hypothetical protein n=1 Tax=Paenibacillus massiliensis TaxID=225917 RepID=UPI00037C3021|nr:hypothetical protein [Paenibacillus massiliensis]
MKNLINKALKTLSQEGHSLILSSIKDRQISQSEKQIIAEYAMALATLSEVESIPPHEKVILKRAFNHAYQIIYNNESLFFYSSFHYSPQNIRKEDTSQQHLIKTNTDTMAMFMHIKAYQFGWTSIGGSVDNYFFSRMDSHIHALRTIIKNNMEDLFTPAIYNLCNLHQTLYLYLISEHTEYHQTAIKLIDKVYKLINEASSNDKIKALVQSNLQLKLFAHCQYYKQQKLKGKTYTFTLGYDLSKYTPTQILRVLSNIWDIDKEVFVYEFQNIAHYLYEKSEFMKPLEKALFLSSISNYYLHTKEQVENELTITESMEQIDISRNMNNIFSNYNKIKDVVLAPSDLTKLYSFKDNELRQKIASIITGVSPVLNQRGAAKPHGVSEISDMEVQVSINGQRYYLCMPFKSGIEIKSESVPENVAYQIVRPFLNFKKCIVVFITAKKCSQNLMNYIKRLKDQFDWPIEVIQQDELAKLLKINNAM